MKLRDKGSLVVYNVPSGVGRKLVASGIAVEVAETAPVTRYAEMSWKVLDGPHEGDYQNPPEIKASCSGCGTPLWQSSRKGTAHQTLNFLHQAGCARVGFKETVPQHIIDEYLRRWTAYKALSRR